MRRKEERRRKRRGKEEKRGEEKTHLMTGLTRADLGSSGSSQAMGQIGYRHADLKTASEWWSCPKRAYLQA